MKVFVDTNIILDVLLERKDFLNDSLCIMQMGFDHSVMLYASPLSFATCHYILRKEYDKQKAIEALRSIKRFVTMTTMDDSQVEESLQSNMPDFEDMLQFHSALAMACDVIITRNKKHFPKEPVPVLTPAEYLEIYT